MTNLEIIKYLATNNPTRLAEFLEDIYCCAWNDGAWDRFGDESSIPNFDKWLHEDGAKSGMHYNYELEEWSKAINKPIRNCLNCAHLGDPIIWCDVCDDFEYWEEEK